MGKFFVVIQQILQYSLQFLFTLYSLKQFLFEIVHDRSAVDWIWLILRHTWYPEAALIVQGGEIWSEFLSLLYYFREVALLFKGFLKSKLSAVFRHYFIGFVLLCRFLGQNWKPCLTLPLYRTEISIILLQNYDIRENGFYIWNPCLHPWLCALILNFRQEILWFLTILACQHLGHLGCFSFQILCWISG